MSEKDLDKLFGDKLGDFEMKPSDDLWSKIAGDIGNAYVPDGGASTSSGAESTGSSSSAGSASSSASSAGTSGTAASVAKGGSSLGAKLFSLKAAIIGVISAVGISTAVILTKSDSKVNTSAGNTSSTIEQVDSKENIQQDVSTSINSSADKVNKTSSSNIIIEDSPEGISNSNNDESNNVSSVIENKDDSELNETKVSSEKSMDKEDSEAEKTEQEAKTSQVKKAKAESLSDSTDDKEDIIVESEESNISSETNKEAEKLSDQNIDATKEENSTNDSDGNKSIESNDKNLKGEGNKTLKFNEGSDSKDNQEEVDKQKDLLNIPPKEHIFKIDSFTEVTDSSMIAAGSIDTKKKKSFLPFRSSFNPIGIYYGGGLGIESTTFTHTQGVFEDNLGSLTLRADIGYEFKNGLFLGLGLTLMASGLSSYDQFNFEIYKDVDYAHVTETTISNGLVETVLDSDWISERLEYFSDGETQVYTIPDENNDENEGDDDWEAFDDWDQDDLEDIEDWEELYAFLFPDWYCQLEEDQFSIYTFSDELKIHDEINRVVLPLNFGYNYNRRRMSYFMQVNAEIHSVLSWDRHIYFRDQLISSDKVQGIGNRMFYGGHVGIGYHFNEGLELRSSFSFTSGVNTHHHGDIENIRLNNYGLNLSLRWRL